MSVTPPAVVLVAASLLAVSACSSSPEPVPVLAYNAVGSDLLVGVGVCNPEDLPVEVTETADEVGLLATAVYEPGDSCTANQRVQLEAPLGDRPVVDRHTGERVAVGG